jgi:diguanylate cyclase (GGDEF)-like protein
MIFESIFLMTIIDIIIISFTGLAFWNFYRNRETLRHLKVFPGVALVLIGLIVISSFYIMDIVSMYLLPWFLSRGRVYEIMKSLHFNFSGLLSTLGVAIIVVSLLYLNRSLFPRIIRLEEELRKRATTDSLTQAYNRSKFDEILKSEINRCRRYNTNLSLLVLDIDHFKKINDNHGHLAGDDILKSVVNLTQNSIRGTDYLARWGGEEFVVLLPETGLDRASALAERIKKNIEDHEFEKIGTVTVSFGVTQWKNNESEDALIKRADDALYRAKNLGRNRVEVGA